MAEYDDDIVDEQEYTKGFNKGYIIAQYEPELGKELAWNTSHENSFTSGLIFGARELFKEKELSRQDELDEIRGQDNTKDHEQDRTGEFDDLRGGDEIGDVGRDF